MLFIATALAGPLLVAAKATVNDVISQLESSQSPLLQYPTQLTQNIVPKPIHSHNDCESPYHDISTNGLEKHVINLLYATDWRDVPLLTALSFGVVSVEADVWLINGTLFVSLFLKRGRIRG